MGTEIFKIEDERTETFYQHVEQVLLSLQVMKMQRDIKGVKGANILKVSVPILYLNFLKHPLHALF